MSFDPLRFRARLATRWLGHSLEHHPCLDSTSSQLKRLSQQGPLRSGHLAIADLQTSGYGQQGRAWRSEPGNLCMSVWLAPEVAQLPLTLLAGVAIAEALRAHSPEIGLKWVNDLVARGRKLGGILAEASPRGVILGVGINLASAALEEAIALGELAELPRRDDLLADMLGGLERELEAVARRGPAELFARWSTLSVTLGQEVIVAIGARELRGIAEALTDTGALRLRMADGREEAIASGTVRRTDGRYC